MSVKATKKFTYGFRKASVLIALINAILLLLVVIGIAYKSVERFLSPQPIESVLVIWVACVGIVINFLSAMLFYRNKEKDLNIKGAYLHLMADALVSIGVVVSAVVISYTQWYWIDPLTSLVIVVVLIVSLVSLLRESVSISLDAVPGNIEIDTIRKIALNLSGIRDIHHIHVWALSTSENALTAHLLLDESVSNEQISITKSSFKKELARLGIQHVTIETETSVCQDDHCH